MKSKPFDESVIKGVFPQLDSIDHIDSGSYKSVYSVSFTDGRSPEVLKIVRLPIQRDTDEGEAIFQQELGRIERELKILNECQSPFVVKTGSIAECEIEIDGVPCFCYSEELLKGDVLSNKIQNATKLPECDKVKQLFKCLVEAIQDLWMNQNIVHRDIKPGNIFSTNDEYRPFILIDLGIAYDVSIPGLTLRKTDIPHTPLYVAPEILDTNFRDTISFRSDLYSAALCVFEYACGKHPLAESQDDLRRTYSRVLHQDPIAIEKVRTDLPIPLCRLVNQLLKKNPSLRPANMNLILNQLR